MANLPISVLPNVTATGVTPNDLLVIVNSGETKNIKAFDFQTYINSGSTQLYEVGSGVDSTQRIGVGADASGNCSFVGGGSGNTATNVYSVVVNGALNTSFCVGAFIGNGLANKALGTASFIGSGYQNTTIEVASTISGGYQNTAADKQSNVSGGAFNAAMTIQSTIGGGCKNTIDNITTSSCYCVYGSTIGGGTLNTISSYSGYYNSYGNTIAGGTCNKTVSSCYNGQTISGGYGNTTSDSFTTIGGGYRNTVSCYYATISGGGLNTASGNGSFIGGGGVKFPNKALGPFSTIVGGSANTAQSDGSFIGGGQSNNVGLINTITNIINFTYTGSSITTGTYLNVSPSSSNLSPGGSGALFNISFSSGTISNIEILNGGSWYSVPEILTFNGSLFPPGVDGLDNVTIEVNKVDRIGLYSSVVGGKCNTVLGSFATVSGGYLNTTSGFYATIGGGANNKNENILSTISGGYCNTIDCLNQCQYGPSASVIGGGTFNRIKSCICSCCSFGNTISGGYSNTTVSSYYDGKFIGGGVFNSAFCDFTTISGGYGNKVLDCGGTIGGGFFNTSNCGVSTASGGYGNFSLVIGSTIGGGVLNSVGIPGTISSYSSYVYTPGTLSGYYGPFPPTCSLTGRGTGSSFYFQYNTGTLSGIYINNPGVGYENGDKLFFCGTCFGGTSSDDLLFTINTTNFGNFSTVSGGYTNVIWGNCSGILGNSNFICNTGSFIVGNNITSSRDNTTYVNCFSIMNIETNPIGCPSGTVYKDGSGFLKIV